MSAHDFSSKKSYDTPDDCDKNAKENQTETDSFYPDPLGLESLGLYRTILCLQKRIGIFHCVGHEKYITYNIYPDAYIYQNILHVLTTRLRSKMFSQRNALCEQRFN